MDAVTPAPLSKARCVVIKVGSSLLVDQDTGQPHAARFAAIAADAAKLRAEGKAIVIVSSGAVALGRRALGLKTGKLRLEEKHSAEHRRRSWPWRKRRRGGGDARLDAGFHCQCRRPRLL